MAYCAGPQWKAQLLVFPCTTSVEHRVDIQLLHMLIGPMMKELIGLNVTAIW